MDGERTDIFHHWHPIEDLPEEFVGYSPPGLEALTKLWPQRVEEARASGELDRFLTRLKRRWSIETGAVEGLYQLSRGVAETLIERGFIAALIPHGANGQLPEEIAMILEDHEYVLDGLFEFVAAKRDLTTSYIKQLHQAICRTQETAAGRDPFGNKTQIPLRKGTWKMRPNSPRRKDGLTHQYCPPEQVDIEIERLLRLHHEHMEKGVSPVVEAAWLHHRFVQIHPFQDGNGRVTRCLSTLVLLRARLLPMIVRVDEKEVYYDTLQAADGGDLRPLIQLIFEDQRRSVREISILARGDGRT